MLIPPPPPPRIGSLPKLPRFDQNFLDTGLGFASQRPMKDKSTVWQTQILNSRLRQLAILVIYVGRPDQGAQHFSEQNAVLSFSSEREHFYIMAITSLFICETFVVTDL